MAQKINAPKVDMYVYMPYGANKPGKIKKILAGNKSQFCQVEVAWVDGSITTEEAYHLSDFNALIADHQKKLNTHTSKLPILQAL